MPFFPPKHCSVPLVGAVVAVCAVATTCLERDARADYSDPGPLTTTTSALAPDAGGAPSGDLVVPDGPGPYPLIVASHGWSAAAEQQLGWAQHFASYGFVVAVPSFPDTIMPNAETDQGIIRGLLAYYGDPATASPAQGKVDRSRVGLEGHSAGGLATTIASAAVKPRATVLFDPVDANDAGAAAYATICSPVLGIFANPSSCNNDSEWSSFKTTSLGPQILFSVVGSTHCDGENTPRSLCGGVCGGAADAQRQLEYARYATAFFLAELTGDGNARAALSQSALAADTKISGVIVTNAPSCTSVPMMDAGGTSGGGSGGDGGAAVGPGDGGQPGWHDAGTGGSRDAGQRDASTAPAPGDAPSPASSGCTCTAQGGGGGGAEASLLMAWLVAWRPARWRRASGSSRQPAPRRPPCASLGRGVNWLAPHHDRCVLAGPGSLAIARGTTSTARHRVGRQPGVERPFAGAIEDDEHEAGSRHAT